LELLEIRFKNSLSFDLQLASDCPDKMIPPAVPSALSRKRGEAQLFHTKRAFRNSNKIAVVSN